MPNFIPSAHPMSYFSAALDHAMSERELNQTQLAKLVGIDGSQVGRYLNADARPDPKVLDRICLVMMDQGPGLAIAYLKDDLPPSVAERVEISETKKEKGAARKTPPPLRLDRLPAKLRRVLEEVIVTAEQNPQVIAAIESMLELTRRR